MDDSYTRDFSTVKPCKISKKGKDKDGYPIIWGYMEGEYKALKEHRIIMARKLRRNLKPDEIIRHLCNNPSCIEITHLAIGTYKDNTQDAIRTGRLSVGSKHPNSKLTEKDIEDILFFYTEGMTGKELAKEYNVSFGHIYKIIRREKWKHVER